MEIDTTTIAIAVGVVLSGLVAAAVLVAALVQYLRLQRDSATMPGRCPRCGNWSWLIRDCVDTDGRHVSWGCQGCALWWDGRRRRWLDDCASCSEEASALTWDADAGPRETTDG